MKHLKNISIALTALVLMASCSDDDTPAPVVEEEVITTMTVTLVPDGGGETITLQTKDLDGDGPNAPVITVSGNLAANKTYTGSIELLNEAESPAEDITQEVSELDEEHQFFFTATNSIATFSYSDMDSEGNPVGLDFELTTANAGSGSITIILVHEPLKNASGVKDGDRTNAGGEEDIEATFQIVVQ